MHSSKKEGQSHEIDTESYSKFRMRKKSQIQASSYHCKYSLRCGWLGLGASGSAITFSISKPFSMDRGFYML